MKRFFAQLIAISIVIASAVTATSQPPALSQTEAEHLPAWASELSASGRYIAGLLLLDDQQDILNHAESTGSLPEVSYRVALWENQNEQVEELTFTAPLLTDAFAVFDIAFSPDETLLAVREDALVRILRVPTLEQEQLIEAPSEQSLFYDELAWSADSRYLAFNDDELALSVWDRETGAVNSSTNNREIAGPITAIPNGWIVRLPFVTEGEERIFRACDLLVERCQVYTLSDLDISTQYESVTASPEGMFVMMEDDTAWWWSRGEGVEFIPSTEPVLSDIRGTIADRPPYFSADSRYLAIPSFYDVTKTDIYEVGSWEQVAPSLPTRLSNFIPNTDAIAWWEGSKEALGITCIGQDETAAVIEWESVSAVTEPFRVSGNGQYILLLTEDTAQMDGLYRVLLPLPEVEC